MSNIQKTLDALQPYVIGIRYLEGTAVVDAVFKDGWTIPEDSNIKRIKGDESLNYYMILSESPNIGLDELLNYVDRTIKLNQEREKKHELLRVKVNELKEIFKKTPLTKLNKLKFVFPDEDLVPNLNDFDVDIEDIDEQPNHIQYTEEIVNETIQTPAPYLDENGNPIELTEEELEILEEEARAARNRKITEQKKIGQKPTPKNKIELPPKRKLEIAGNDINYQPDCDCGPDEACDKCIESKDL